MRYLIAAAMIVFVGACQSKPPVSQETLSVNTPVLVGEPHEVRLTIHNDRAAPIAVVPPPGVTGSPVAIAAGSSTDLTGLFYRVTKPADWEEDDLFGLLQIEEDDGVFLFAQSGATAYLEESAGNAYVVYLDVDGNEWKITAILEKEGLAPGLALVGEARIAFSPLTFATIAPVAGQP